MFELRFCRLGVPAIASSIGRTIESRMTVGDAPPYCTETLIVGVETFGNCCWTSVRYAIVPASPIRASNTKTSGGRRTKSDVNDIVLPLRDLLRRDGLTVGEPGLSVGYDGRARRDAGDDRVRAVVGDHGHLCGLHEAAVHHLNGRVRGVEERRVRNAQPGRDRKPRAAGDRHPR